jgi:hypothetical protein
MNSKACSDPLFFRKNGQIKEREATMNWHTMIVDMFDKVSMVVGQTLEGLSPEDVNEQPKSDCNSIGWLVWHLLRVQDLTVSTLSGEEQVWITGGWHAKFDRPSDPRDFGLGHTPEDLAAFKTPDIETLLGYEKAVVDRTKRYLNNLPESELDRKLDHPVFPTVGAHIMSAITDNLQHAGQAGYVRGLLKGRGWFPV